jgi:phosphate/sulfate permease
MHRLLSGNFMGWSLGSNDSANIFGTAVFSMAETARVFAIIGVPVSTSRTIIGSVLGIGIHKGVQTLKIRTHLPLTQGPNDYLFGSRP